MKKERDCNGGKTPYPIYQPYPMGGVMPQMMPNMMPQMNPNMMNQNFGYNNFNQTGTSTIEQQINNLNNQVNSLERRISNLENMIGNTSTQYNTSNYQVM